MRYKLKSVIGEKFGDVTIIDNAYYKPNTTRKVLIECICKNTKVVTLSDLRAGYIKSCGCKQYDTVSTHRQSKTPLYRVWTNMKSRCLNVNAQYYEEYGGRGITICKSWLSYETFCKWAMTNGYDKDLTLDRKDNNKGYKPSNCRWVTRVVNQSNRRAQKNSTSRYVGVAYIKENKLNPWLASIKHDGVNTKIGVFAKELDAAEARDDYVIKHNLPHTINLRNLL